MDEMYTYLKPKMKNTQLLTKKSKIHLKTGEKPHKKMKQDEVVSEVMSCYGEDEQLGIDSNTNYRILYFCDLSNYMDRADGRKCIFYVKFYLRIL